MSAFPSDPGSSKRRASFLGLLFKCSSTINKIHSGECCLDEFPEQLIFAELFSLVLKASGEVDKVMIYRFVRDIPKK